MTENTANKEQVSATTNAVINEFSAMSPLQKFGVLANILSVVGISLATFVTLPIISNLLGKEFSLLDFMISIIFSGIVSILFIALTIGMGSEIIASIKRGDIATASGIILFALVLYAVGGVVAQHAYYFIGDALNVSYMLANPAKSAVKKIYNIKRDQPYGKPDLFIMKGNVEFNQGNDFQDYSVMLYGRPDGSTLFEAIRPESGESNYTFDVAEDMSFEIPGINLKEYKNNYDLFVVIVRKTDSWVFESSRHGFPTGVTTMTGGRMRKIQPFIYKLQLSQQTDGE